MHHTLFCDVGWDNGDLLRPCSGSPWRTTMPGHPQVMQRRNDTQRSNLFFCREIHHISKFQIESNRFISYHIIFMYVFGWMEGWCSSLLHPQSKLVKTTKGESSAQSESCEDQWFQCMDIYIYITHTCIYTKDDHRWSISSSVFAWNDQSVARCYAKHDHASFFKSWKIEHGIPLMAINADNQWEYDWYYDYYVHSQ